MSTDMVSPRQQPFEIHGESLPPADRARTVRVRTGARLHFGLLAERNAAGRSFGGCGLMIDRPGYDLELRLTGDSPAPADDPARIVISIPEAWPDRNWIHERIRQTVERMQQAASCLPDAEASRAHWSAGAPDRKPESCEITVQAAVPPHRGLGAGTQLALAVAGGLTQLRNQPVPHAPQLAAQTGRGLRSAVGLHGFLQGGFLVDGGKQPGAVAGSLAARIPFPEDWRIVLLAPSHQQGLSGEKEVQAFDQAVRIPDEVTSELCRKIVMELMPAVTEADFSGFSRGLYEYGAAVGECFRSAQGGRYATPELDRLVALLRGAGLAGTGQTSWGPSIFALCATEAEANDLAQSARNGSVPGGGRLPCPCTVEVAAPLNRGATFTARPAGE